MKKNIIWYITECVFWYLFFYVILYSIKNPINIKGMALLLLILSSLGIFASPLTRHFSIWNKLIDKKIKTEEEKARY
jgi:hypothetical protein